MTHADVMIFDRMRPGVEELELVDLLAERDVSAEIVDWEDLSFCAHPFSLLLRGRTFTPPTVGVVRSRVLTRHEALLTL